MKQTTSVSTDEVLEEERDPLAGSPVIVALDYPEPIQALEFVDQLKPDFRRLKIGKEMFTHAGPELVRILRNRGFDIFLDLKFHDIPNTVAKAVAAAADLGVWMVNVHAGGGSKMMEAAAKELQMMDSQTLLIAVTVLTSMEQSDLTEAFNKLRFSFDLPCECSICKAIKRLSPFSDGCSFK